MRDREGMSNRVTLERILERRDENPPANVPSVRHRDSCGACGTGVETRGPTLGGRNPCANARYLRLLKGRRAKIGLRARDVAAVGWTWGTRPPIGVRKMTITVGRTLAPD